MNHYAWTAAFMAALCVSGVMLAVAGADAAPTSSRTGPDTLLAERVTFEAAPADEPMHVVTISRGARAGFGRQRVLTAADLPAERRMQSEIVTKDIQVGGATYSPERQFFVTSVARPVPDSGQASSVEVRAITRMGRPADWIVVAESSDTEALRETVRNAGSVVSVDVGTSRSTTPLRRTIPSAPEGAAVTIVGRPGEKVQELTGDEVHVIADEAPVLNQMSARAIEQEAAARQEREAQMQASQEERQNQLEGDSGVEGEPSESGEAGEYTVRSSPVDTPAPPGPRVVETERRYDWRKGVYVRVPKDAPPIPAPTGVYVPAARVTGDTGAPLTGRVPRYSTPAAEPTPGDAAPATE